MKIYTTIQALKLLCKSTNKFGMLINCQSDLDYDEIIKAAPYLEGRDQILVDGMCYLLFDSEEEMLKYFHLTVGDDGPTKLNSYNGPMRVYALTCSPQGELLTENT